MGADSNDEVAGCVEIDVVLASKLKKKFGAERVALSWASILR